jgi:hypothetical protein
MHTFHKETTEAVAALPEAKARPHFPLSMEATLASNPARVGFPVRAYSYPCHQITTHQGEFDTQNKNGKRNSKKTKKLVGKG